MIYVPQAGVIGGRQYLKWRHKGVAFEIREGTYDTPNRTLASGMVFKQVRGYCNKSWPVCQGIVECDILCQFWS